MLIGVKQAEDANRRANLNQTASVFDFRSEGIFLFDPSRPHVLAVQNLFVVSAAKAKKKRSGGGGAE